jgi:hypothetical protein
VTCSVAEEFDLYGSIINNNNNNNNNNNSNINVNCGHKINTS